MKSPAERAKAYRERRKAAKAAQAAREPLSKEQRIALLESKLAAAGPKAHAALDREIALLKGEIRPYAVKVADRQARDAQLKGGAGLGRPIEGLLFVEMVERLAGVDPDQNFAYPDLTRYLSATERKQLDSEARRIELTPEELEAWEDAEMIRHPLWSRPVRPAATEIPVMSEKDERIKLLKLLLPNPRPTADILDPTELPGTGQPMTPGMVNRLNAFYEFDAASPEYTPDTANEIDPFYRD